MKVALYARVSTKDKGQDVENQFLQLRDYAAKQGWEIVTEYADNASGKRSDREQLQKMFSAASRREFDILLFWSLDRLSREGTVETLNHLQRLVGYGVKWRSYTEQWIDSTGPFAEAITGFMAAIAKNERVRIVERVRAGLDRAKAGGWKRTHGIGGGRPVATFDRAKAVILKAEGKSLRAIAAELNTTAPTLQRYFKTLASNEAKALEAVFA